MSAWENIRWCTSWKSAPWDLYLSGSRTEAAAYVPADLLEHTSLIGSRSYVRDRLRQHAAAGVTVLNITPVQMDAVEAVRQLRELVDEL